MTPEFFDRKEINPTTKKKRNYWKILAIALTIFFMFVASWIIVGSYIYNKDLERANICFYDICSEGYHNWGYEDHNCTCYLYDEEELRENNILKLIPVHSEIIP